MVRQFTFNLYFIVVIDVVILVGVNKDLIFFFAFLDLQSIRDDEATNHKELIFVNALNDVLITSRKTRVEVTNSGKTMTFCESIRAFPKISEISRFRSFQLQIIGKDSCLPWHLE